MLSHIDMWPVGQQREMKAMFHYSKLDYFSKTSDLNSLIHQFINYIKLDFSVVLIIVIPTNYINIIN